MDNWLLKVFAKGKDKDKGDKQEDRKELFHTIDKSVPKWLKDSVSEDKNKQVSILSNMSLAEKIVELSLNKKGLALDSEEWVKLYSKVIKQVEKGRAKMEKTLLKMLSGDYSVLNEMVEPSREYDEGRKIVSNKQAKVKKEAKEWDFIYVKKGDVVYAMETGEEVDEDEILQLIMEDVPGDFHDIEGGLMYEGIGNDGGMAHLQMIDYDPDKLEALAKERGVTEASIQQPLWDYFDDEQNTIYVYETLNPDMQVAIDNKLKDIKDEAERVAKEEAGFDERHGLDELDANKKKADKTVKVTKTVEWLDKNDKKHTKTKETVTVVPEGTAEPKEVATPEGAEEKVVTEEIEKASGSHAFKCNDCGTKYPDIMTSDKDVAKCKWCAGEEDSITEEHIKAVEEFEKGLGKESAQALEIKKTYTVEELKGLGYIVQLDMLDKGQVTIMDATGLNQYNAIPEGENAYKIESMKDIPSTEEHDLNYFKEQVKSTTYKLMTYEGDVINLKDWDAAKKELASILNTGSDISEDALVAKLIKRKVIPADTTDLWSDPEGLEYVMGDNTYNWGYLAPDMNIKVYKEKMDDKFYAVVSIHQGGDVRGNYGPGYVYMGSSKDEVVERWGNDIRGNTSANISFSDGSSIQFDGQQDSDLDYFEVYGEPTGIARECEKLLEGVKHDSDFDAMVHELLGAAIDKKPPTGKKAGLVWDIDPNEYMKLFEEAEAAINSGDYAKAYKNITNVLENENIGGDWDYQYVSGKPKFSVYGITITPENMEEKKSNVLKALYKAMDELDEDIAESKVETDMNKKASENYTVDEMAGFFEYLDTLRESGACNMYGAGAYLIRDMDVLRQEANSILGAWMETYGDGTETVEVRVGKAKPVAKTELTCESKLTVEEKAKMYPSMDRIDVKKEAKLKAHFRAALQKRALKDSVWVIQKDEKTGKESIIALADKSQYLSDESKKLIKK